MFNFLASWFRDAGRRTAGKSRSRRAARRLEHLEPRCVLSLAPPAVGQLPQAEPIELDWTDWDYVLPIEDIGSGNGGWQHEWPWDPTFDHPGDVATDWPPADGYININDLPTDPSGGPVFSEFADQEAREVLRLIAGLKYTPRDWTAEGIALPGTGEANDTVQPEAVRTGAAESRSTIPLAVDVLGPAHRQPAEGGMIALVRLAPMTEAAVESAPVRDRPSLPPVPVQMDSVYGKFQVFEVSTGVEVPSPIPTPAGPSNPRTPLTPPQRVTPQPKVEPLQDSAAGPGVSPSGAPDAPPVTKTSAVHHAALQVALPMAIDERSASRLNVAAALFVVVASAARQAAASQPDDRARTML